MNFSNFYFLGDILLLTSIYKPNLVDQVKNEKNGYFLMDFLLILNKGWGGG